MARKNTMAIYATVPRPDFRVVVKSHKEYKNNYNAALRYAHYELTSADLKKEVAKYLKALDNKNPLLEKIKDIHENRFSVIGKYMYILNHGGELPENVMPSVMPFLEKLIDEEEIKTEEARKVAASISKKEEHNNDAVVTAKAVISIQDRLREKAKEVAAEVEGWIDNLHTSIASSTPKTVDEFVNFFKSSDLKSPHMRHIQNIFQSRANEISEAVSGKDKTLTEGYSNFSKPELKRFELFFKNLLKACEMMQEVAKAERAPRKRKPVSQEKLVAKLKFKKEDASLGIVSVSPIQILGAKEVWVYNTKTRKLSQYKALDERGLNVSGASLDQYSSDSAEKTLRKPAEQLAEFKKASKVKLRTFLKDLSTIDVKCSGKLNEHCVILRVDK